ncbi:hypothetical protein [Streptomyces sp. NPDC097619]|uniref:hypothetical protein n=1 Tax=Streptomyces sp. NPDC097619 TaxID=3157228 RepID=UPI0033241FD9
MPPRTRKTTSDDPEQTPETPVPEGTTEVPEDKATLPHETKLPEVAPLEPPPAPEPLPEPDPLTTAQQLLPAQLGDRIVDDATGEPPPDPDTVFVPVLPHGNTLRCSVRLIEHVGLGPYRSPITRLLVPIGAELKRGQAARVVARLHEQLAQAR